MIVLGVVLIVFGSLLAYFGRHNSESVAWWGGLIVFGGGVVLFVIGVLDASGADTRAMIGGTVAMAVVPPHLHGPHDHDPSIPVAAGKADTQPVLVAFIVGAVPLIIAAVSALAGIFTAMPDWIVPVFTVAGTLTTGLAALWARSRVTPVALPRLDDRTPLVPMVENEQT